MTERTFRRLVFGDDGSVHADRAWLWINNQRWPGFEAWIVNSISRTDDVASNDTMTLGEVADASRKAFAESELAAVSSFRTDAQPCAILSELHGDITVVGPRSKRLLRSLTMGSTSEHLMCRPIRPLLVAATSRPVRKAFVCVDGSPTSLAAAEFFATLPLAGDADEIVVLGVRVSGLDVASGAVEETVEEAAARLMPIGARPLLLEAETTAGSAIVDAARELGADLIVTGSTGSGRVARALVGSTTRTISRSGVASMLVMPAAR